MPSVYRPAGVAFGPINRWRLVEAAAHPREGAAEFANLVAPAGGELGRIGLAQTDIVARREIRTTGRTTVRCSSTLSTIMTPANTAASSAIAACRLRSAVSSATAIGTETICAATVSPMLQPNPLLLPYRASSAGGARSGVEWQVRHASLETVIGRASVRTGPVGVARSAGLVGLSAASLQVKSG
jgi:hypothetical protein